MFSSAVVLFDFAGSLAIIFVLTLVFGQVQRRYYSQKRGQILLGLAFGGVACLQMNLPLEPMPGMIIDLRNIPLVLCGAFLGWRASLLCFVVAALTRIGIGGIGMYSGVLGMMISINVGAAWAYATKALPKRDLRHVMVLSVIGSLHLVAAVVLPEAARDWFLSNAALPIAVMNFVSILLAASFLDAEQRKIDRENRLAASAAFDPDHGALTKPAFEREIMLRVSAGTMAPPAALLVINLRYTEVLFSIIPNTWRDRVLGLVRLRLKESFENADLACSLGTTALVFPLDEMQVQNKGAIQSSVMQLMRSEPFHFSDNISKLVAVDTRVQMWNSDKSLEEVLIAARFSLLPKRQSQIPLKSSIVNAVSKPAKRVRKLKKSKSLVSYSTTEALFSKAAFLMRPSGSSF